MYKKKLFKYGDCVRIKKNGESFYNFVDMPGKIIGKSGIHIYDTYIVSFDNKIENPCKGEEDIGHFSAITISETELELIPDYDMGLYPVLFDYLGETVIFKHKDDGDQEYFLEELATIQLLKDDVLSVCAYNDYLSLDVICNDIFAWGCADSEGISSREELKELFKMHMADRDYGSIKWVCKKRNEKPQKPILESMINSKKWESWMDSLDENYYDRKCRVEFDLNKVISDLKENYFDFIDEIRLDLGSEAIHIRKKKCKYPDATVTFEDILHNKFPSVTFNISQFAEMGSEKIRESFSIDSSED